MAISIAYGISIATLLTLVMLPMLLALSNQIKRAAYKLWNQEEISAEEVERAIKEIKSEQDAAEV